MLHSAPENNPLVAVFLGAAGIYGILQKVPQDHRKVVLGNLQFFGDIRVYGEVNLIVPGLLGKMQQQEIYGLILTKYNRAVLRQRASVFHEIGFQLVEIFGIQIFCHDGDMVP